MILRRADRLSATDGTMVCWGNYTWAIRAISIETSGEVSVDLERHQGTTTLSLALWSDDLVEIDDQSVREE